MKFIIAVKKEMRTTAPKDWIKPLRNIKGITIKETANPYRIQVDAPEDTGKKIRIDMGNLCHIETEINHRAL